MKPTEDYHKLQKCEYYQSEECDCLTECSAILKESTPSTEQVSATEAANEMWKDVLEAAKEVEQESQEELWRQVYSICQRGPSPDLSTLQKQFTITRKP